MESCKLSHASSLWLVLVPHVPRYTRLTIIVSYLSRNLCSALWAPSSNNTGHTNLHYTFPDGKRSSVISLSSSQLPQCPAWQQNGQVCQSSQLSKNFTPPIKTYRHLSCERSRVTPHTLHPQSCNCPALWTHRPKPGTLNVSDHTNVSKCPGSWM